MYSHEIQELLRIKNNLISVKEYLEIIKSPQINQIKFDNEQFYLWTDDNYKFTLKIERNKT